MEVVGGNPVAVVLDAEGPTDAQMQALTAELGHVETGFVLPPAYPSTAVHRVSPNPRTTA